MTKTTIVTAVRLILSLAIAGPAQAWPGHPGGAGIAAPAHPHIRKTEHAAFAPAARLPNHEEDPLASMHFE